mgnify:FL=1
MCLCPSRHARQPFRIHGLRVTTTEARINGLQDSRRRLSAAMRFTKARFSIYTVYNNCVLYVKQYFQLFISRFAVCQGWLRRWLPGATESEIHVMRPWRWGA